MLTPAPLFPAGSHLPSFPVSSHLGPLPFPPPPIYFMYGSFCVELRPVSCVLDIPQLCCTSLRSPKGVTG